MTVSVQQRVSLRAFNTLDLNVVADRFLELNDSRMLAELPGLCRGQPWLVIGGGSNLVLAADFHGLVILNRLRGIECLQGADDSVLVRIAGGENWDALVAHCLQQGWYGLENLSAIPGTVGAAPVQNIGAYGVELRDFLESVEILSLPDGETRILHRDDCRFGYRDSIFKHAWRDRCLITHITLRLSRTPALKLDYGEIRAELAVRGWAEAGLTPQQLRQIIIDVRARKLPDPVLLPNVGSFFKNPIVTREQLLLLQRQWPDIVHYPVDERRVKLAAGWLIDRLGWKGRRLGQARVHERQALVLINQGENAVDLLALAHEIQQDVKTRFGVDLEPEPRVIGPA